MANHDEFSHNQEWVSPDEEVQAEVSQVLERSGHLGLRGVAVRVERDRIVLSGTVASYFLKQIAQEAARRACPSRRVYNELNVTEPS